MNSLAFFGVIVLTIGRLLIFIIAIEYWFRHKSRSHALYLIGAGSWVFAGILAILADIIVDPLIAEMLTGLNTGFSAIGFVFFMSGFLSYYNLINLRFIGIYGIFSFVVPLTISLANLSDRLVIVVFAVQYFIIVLLIVIGLLYRKRIVVQAESSLKYYYAIILNIVAIFIIIIFIILQGEEYGLYYSSNDLLILINFSAGVVLTFLLLVFMIQLEHDHNQYLMLKFKDNYSHDLGNNLQKIYSSLELIELSNDNKPLEAAKKIVTESAELIEEIRDL